MVATLVPKEFLLNHYIMPNNELQIKHVWNSKDLTESNIRFEDFIRNGKETTDTQLSPIHQMLLTIIQESL